VTLPAAHPSKKPPDIYSRPAFIQSAAKKHQPFSYFGAKFQKISSVTVFTEVVAMISSFHRLSEKKKRTKNHEN